MEANLTVTEEKSQPQSKKRGRPKPFMRMPAERSHHPSPEEIMNLRKRAASQRELEVSTVNLLKSSLSQCTNDENHAKKFKTEIDTSTAIPLLLEAHLGWVTKLPPPLQLLTLVGEKWMRTRLQK